ncbi:MAG: ethanolamine ammonia-lyase reactivating factor EutA [Candidatus Dojkabacteria bacterium]|nr:ethanolamine ammonia-lyase reactivating factor EutA [Candidatus Dojkabacteria bacterium]
MIFTKTKKNTNNKYITLDIGTEFLKIVFFAVEDNNVVIEKYLKKKQHSVAMKNGTITSIRRVIETIEEALMDLKFDAKEFDGVIMGIAGELVKGITVEAKYTRKKPNSQITRDEIIKVQELITEEAYKEAQNLIFGHIGDTTGEISHIELVNVIIIDSRIDNFRVEDPIGMTGTNVTIKFYFTFAPIVHVNYLKSITNHINLPLLGIVSQPFAIARSIKGSKNEEFSGIIIDIGGGTTDLALVKNGIVLGTQMLAFGGRVFTKRISNDLRISIPEAEDFKIKYSNSELTEIRISEVRNSILKDTPIWAAQVAIGLEEFLTLTNGFPSQFYLCGGGSYLPEIKTALIEYPWTKELPFNRAPKVNYLLPKDLEGIIDQTNLLSGYDDVTPASITRFLLEILNY